METHNQNKNELKKNSVQHFRMRDTKFVKVINKVKVIK